MRNLHSSTMYLFQLLQASLILYSTLQTTASPVKPSPVVVSNEVASQSIHNQQQQQQEFKPEIIKQQVFNSPPVAATVAEPQVPVAVKDKNVEKAVEVLKASPPVVNEVHKSQPTKVQQAQPVQPIVVVPVQQLTVAKSPEEPSVKVVAQTVTAKKVVEEVKPIATVPLVVRDEPTVFIVKHEVVPVRGVQNADPIPHIQPQIQPQVVGEIKPQEVKKLEHVHPEPLKSVAPMVPIIPVVKPVERVVPIVDKRPLIVEQQAAAPKQEILNEPSKVKPEVVPTQPKVSVVVPVAQVKAGSPDPVVSSAQAVSSSSSSSSKAPHVVKGGLGPLHLLAFTLCSYQPEKLVADETLNLLYSQRAALRKSLFDFMSLKFTNLEKLSSRLNSGFASLEVVPPKKTDPQVNSGLGPSHGWPVVGVCTAHDLKLMAEAAWCDAPVQPSPSSPTTEALDKQEPKIISNKHLRSDGSRSLDSAPALVPAEHSSVISKILHVNDVKDAPVIESSLASLNLTQQQLASIQQAQSNSPRECRRNALRLTRALFNHLAEDQKYDSESWPKLYSQLSEDECARKRMIDVVTALASFRGESTSIRRDNVEYAFAMDDLRSKVLESEVNTPLIFDKQFIEVEQFLQQSVKLMLANIDPERARLTSMRYRSLMAGPVASDDQCIELHQRLLSKNYPTDCNPNQFGQLRDVLRMAASSLALWSIEAELSKYSAKFQDYPIMPIGAQVKEDVNECIANLVAS